MADQDPKAELSKDALAPTEEVREDLVATAVKFLQNPKVTQSPLSTKKAFLQRKGLTAEEVELAIQRSGIVQTPGQTSAISNVSPGLAGQPPALPSKHPDPVVSKWVKARDVLTVITMVTGISYAAYRLYKEFLRPWLFGEPPMSRRLEQLEKMMAESVGNVNTSLAAIEQGLKTQQEKLQVLSHDVNSKTGGVDSVAALQNTHGLNDIKTELTSIKGLLLNRRQFPPMPSSSPVLPAWQLATSSGDASSSAEANSNNKGREEEEPLATPQVSLTTSPLPGGSEPGSPVTMETSEDTTETEQTVMPLSEDLKPAELSASDLQDENDLEHEVKEPEVKVTSDEEDSGSQASMD